LPTIPTVAPGFANVGSTTRQFAGSRNLLNGIFVDAAAVVAPLAAASAGFGAQEFSVTLRDSSDIAASVETSPVAFWVPPHDPRPLPDHEHAAGLLPNRNLERGARYGERAADR